MIQIRIDFQSIEDNLALKGYYIYSPLNEHFIIFCHGRGGTKESFLEDYMSLSVKLYNCGCNLFFFDFRGHGESTPSEYTYGFFEYRDVLGAINMLKNKFVKNRNIGILGFSLGAASAMLAVERNNEDKIVKALVSESGFSSAENVMVMIDPNGEVITPEMPEHTAAVINYKKQNKLYDVAPIEKIDRISPCALFLIDGEKEKRDNCMMFEKAKEPKQLWLIPNARHGNAYFTAKEEYENKVTEFFVKYLM